MELRKSLDFRKVLIAVYFVCFAIYLIVGLQPAEAVNYEITAELAIPSIDLVSDVTTLKLEGSKLETPDTIVGSFSKAQNKTLLIGHASTVFQNLKDLNLGDEIIYDGDVYEVTNMEILEKSAVSMRKVLAKTEKMTIEIMTCAGEDLGGGDSTHRLIVTAVKK